MARFAGHETIEPRTEGAEERTGNCLIEAKARRQLHQKRAEAVTEGCDLRKQAVQRFDGVGKPARVGDLARHFGRETKIRRYRGGPACIGRRIVRPIKAGVDLDTRESRGIALKMCPLGRELRDVRPGDGPAGGSDPDQRDGYSFTAPVIDDT
jgi:hypothetical protein